jgi:hypothetical protein
MRRLLHWRGSLAPALGAPAKSIASPKRKTSQARTLLATVYRRFTEGFDTADVVTAKTLLESFR